MHVCAYFKTNKKRNLSRYPEKLKVHEKNEGFSIFFLALLKPHANLCQQLYSCCLFSNPEQKGGDQWFLINMLTVLQNHSEKGVNRFTSPTSGEVFIFLPTSDFIQIEIIQRGSHKTMLGDLVNLTRMRVDIDHQRTGIPCYLS